jgi:hypothetical protein
MSAISSSVDAGSKRWLVVLGVAVLVSIVILAHSFLNALFPSKEETVAVSVPVRTEQAVTRSEPDWNSARVGAGQVPQAIATKPDPFAAKYAAEAKAATAHDPVAHQQAVHQQAEYFRALISQGKLPECYGKLTKEQVDQMEKKGVMIN